MIFVEVYLVFTASKTLGVEESIKAKSHAPSSSLNLTLINPLMLA
jgi:hypothetical protein